MIPDPNSPFAAREARQWTLVFEVERPVWNSTLTRMDHEPTENELDDLLERYGAARVVCYQPGQKAPYKEKNA